MTEEIEPLTASQAICAIPVEVRPAVCAWLEALAVNADTTAGRLLEEHKKTPNETVRVTALYWVNVASGHRLAAARMRMSGPVPDRAPGGKKHVRRK